MKIENERFSVASSPRRQYLKFGNFRSSVMQSTARIRAARASTIFLNSLLTNDIVVLRRCCCYIFSLYRSEWSFYHEAI